MIGEYAEALIWAVALALVLTVRAGVQDSVRLPCWKRSRSAITCWSANSSTALNPFSYLIRGVELRSGTSSCSVTQGSGLDDYIASALWVPATAGDGTRYCTATALKCRAVHAAFAALIMIPGRDNWGRSRARRQVFALGDNRDDSADSCFWGFLDRNDIRGKA